MTHNQLTLQANKIAQENMRINDFAAKETQRHNVAQETENVRHNFREESIKEAQNAINNFIAQENQRHNQRIEEINERNVAVAEYTAMENRRHNVAQEAINRWQVQVDESRVAETIRHNKNDEVISRSRMLSQSRVDSAKAANLNQDTSKKTAETDYLNASMPWRLAADVEKVILEPIKVGSQLSDTVINAVGSSAMKALAY